MEYTFEMKLAPFIFYNASIGIKRSVGLCLSMLFTADKIHKIRSQCQCHSILLPVGTASLAVKRRTSNEIGFPD